MAYRINERLVEWPDGTHYDGNLDYTLGERARVVAAHLLVLLAVIAIVLFLSLPGQS
jgi:hypothetical protein